jgi:hypothetical protein
MIRARLRQHKCILEQTCLGKQIADLPTVSIDSDNSSVFWTLLDHFIVPAREVEIQGHISVVED